MCAGENKCLEYDILVNSSISLINNLNRISKSRTALQVVKKGLLRKNSERCFKKWPSKNTTILMPHVTTSFFKKSLPVTIDPVRIIIL